MTLLLADKHLVFVTGKGGVGKTTVAAALGTALARAGRRTIICEVSAQHRVTSLLGGAAPEPGVEVRVADGLWTTTIDPNRALTEWLARQLPSKSLVNVLTRSNLFQYFVAAAPGARELVTVTKLWELAQSRRWSKGAEGYDVVVADLPASGHGLGLLRAAGTFADIARVGPIASQAGKVRDTVEDPVQSAVVAVALPGELPVTETLELEGRVGEHLHRPVDAIIANAVLPQRWPLADLDALARADGAVPAAARRAAQSEAGRAHVQREQLERLRAHALAPVLQLPYLAADGLSAEDVGFLGHELEAELRGI